MLLSPDYTSLRVAVLTEDVINKLLKRYNAAYFLDEIKEMNLRLSKELPGKEDLVTEWFLKCVISGGGDIDYLDDYIDNAKFFFAHYKEKLFKSIISEYNEEVGAEVNPTNLLDFNESLINKVRGWYNEEIKASTINLLPDQLPKGSQLIYDDGTYQVVEASDIGAVCTLGKGTKWCTKEEQPASRYLSKGPLYIFYRGKNKWLQMTMGGKTEGAGSVEINDIKNKPVKINDEIRDALIKSGFMDKIMEKVTRSYDKESEFTRFVGEKPNPYMVKKCTEHPLLAYLYAKLVINGPFPQGENAIAKDAYTAMRYVRDITKKRFLKVEPLIKQLGLTEQYADVLKSVNKNEASEFWQSR